MNQNKPLVPLVVTRIVFGNISCHVFVWRLEVNKDTNEDDTWTSRLIEFMSLNANSVEKTELKKNF